MAAAVAAVLEEVLVVPFKVVLVALVRQVGIQTLEAAEAAAEVIMAAVGAAAVTTLEVALAMLLVVEEDLVT